LEYKYFRDIMEVWDSKIDALLDGEGTVLYFQKDGDLFGTGEDSRVVFAKLKNPDDELPEGWADDANFSADNLSKSLKGDECKHMFGKSDLDKIKIIDRDEAFNKMKDMADELGDEAFPEKKPSTHFISFSDLADIIGQHKDPDHAPNFIQTSED
jgi:hypothetical protein